MGANHSRDPLDVIDALARKVADLEAARALGAQAATCTSTSRPANPARGRIIVETDTGLEATWNGSSWMYDMQQVAPTQVLPTGANIAAINFGPIPACRSLRLQWRAQLTAAGPTDVFLTVDGDATAHYTWGKLSGHNAAASSSNGAGLVTATKVGVIAGAASYFSSGEVRISGWSTSTGYLTTSATSCTWNGAASDWEELYSGSYTEVGPHTSLTIFPGTAGFGPGSEFSLYGSM